jgi:uncharacterized protein (TIGR00297 family)
MALLEALGVTLALGLLALALRAVRPSGFVGGVALGTVIYLGAGRQGFIVLAGFFLLGTFVTRLGYATKSALGVAEERRGRRGVSHALANGLTGGLLAGVMGLGRSLGWDGPEILLRMGYTAAFATAAADTTSTEIGGLWGRHSVSLRTFRPVPVGTGGAVSLQGTSAGSAAALLMGLLGWGIGWFGGAGFGAVLVVALVATLGNLGESFAASWGFRKKGHHQVLNFLNTVTGAVLAIILGALLGMGSG